MVAPLSSYQPSGATGRQLARKAGQRQVARPLPSTLPIATGGTRQQAQGAGQGEPTQSVRAAGRQPDRT